MTKFLAYPLFILALIFGLSASAADYGKVLSAAERQNICNSIKAQKQQNSESNTSLDNPVIPNGILLGIYDTTRNISLSVSLVSVLGDTLMCHAVHGNAQEKVDVLGVTLFKVPNFSMWLCGMIIYFFGFMMVLSVSFYVVDISFKLGMAVLLLPIAIALWPFSAKIKDLDLLSKLISIMLKSAAIFIFLAITAAFAVNMLTVALGGIEEVFDVITENADSDIVTDNFTLTSSAFLIVVFALLYGFKLIGSAITDYADKIFADKAFGNAQPIHGMMTQSIDFAKKKVVSPVTSFARDVAITQTGRVVQGAGKVLKGDYNRQIGAIVRHPRSTFKKAGLSLADKGASAVGAVAKTGTNLFYGAKIGMAGLAGKKAGQDLKADLRQARNLANSRIDDALHSDIRAQRQNITDSINAAEKARQEARENNPSARQRRLSRREQKIENAENAIRSINKERDKKLNAVDMSQFDGRVDKGVKAITNVTSIISKPFKSATTSIKNAQTNLYNQINNGVLGDKRKDNLAVWATKKVARGTTKALVGAPLGLSRAVTGALGAVTNLPTRAVEITGTIVKAGASGVANGVSNIGTRVSAGVRKLPNQVKKAWYKAPDTLNPIKAFGRVLDRVGGEMSNNAPQKTHYNDLEDERLKNKAYEDNYKGHLGG